MAHIRVENLVKVFGDVVRAVDDVTFTVEGGEVITLLGPSGCGKSTTLRCIAGLEQPTSGRIWIGDDLLYDSEQGINVPTEQRSIGMMFQSYAIWPHLRVFDNIAFPLRIRRDRSSGRDDIRQRVAEVLETVGLTGYERRYPSELSGGQQQRVVLARCLVYRPTVMLLDEPLANLDAKLRETMRFELREVVERFNLTTVYVTHDQAEAMALSDRMFVMRDGVMLRVGPPRQVFRSPDHPFVADFLGVSNVFHGDAVEAAGAYTRVRLDRGGVEVLASGHAEPGARVSVAIRPREVRLAKGDANPARQDNAFTGRIERATYLGEELDCLVAVGDLPLRVRTTAAVTVEPGDEVTALVDADDIALMEPDEEHPLASQETVDA